MLHPGYIVGQDALIELYPEDGPALGGTATLELYNCEDTPLATYTVNQDDFSQELNADAAAGQPLISVGDASALFQDWRGWLSSDWGEGEEVIVQGKLASGVVRLANALTFSHDADATPKPALTRHLYAQTVPAAVIGSSVTRDNWAIWTWKNAQGHPCFRKWEFDVIATPWYVDITAYDIRKVMPSILSDASGRAAWRAMAEGCKEQILIGLKAAKVKPDLVMDVVIFKRLTCLKLAHMWLLQGGSLNQDELELLKEWKKEYASLLQLVVRAELTNTKKAAARAVRASPYKI